MSDKFAVRAIFIDAIDSIVLLVNSINLIVFEPLVTELWIFDYQWFIGNDRLFICHKLLVSN